MLGSQAYSTRPGDKGPYGLASKSYSANNDIAVLIFIPPARQFLLSLPSKFAAASQLLDRLPLAGRYLKLNCTGTESRIFELAISCGGAGTGDDRCTISSAARSSSALPDERVTREDVTCPEALIVKATCTLPCSRRDFGPFG